VTLRPGALFVVGDPKQSIYRFRRADIEIYNEVRTRLGGDDGREVLRLTTNFRSVPGLCTWANKVFAGTFPPTPTPRSPMFAPLDAHRDAKKGHPEIAVVDLADVAEAEDVAPQEASRVARYIRAEVDAGRRGYGDFLILTRKKKSLRPYAAALEALQVPIEVTGAGAFDESEEVREVALLLAALADPQDAVSLVGVLRGTLFGCSDQELFAFRQAGGYFNLFSEIATTDMEAARVASAFASLRRWHGWTRALPAGAALERIFEDSGYLALAATSRGGVEAGDLLHAIDRVRAVVETGFTLAEAADALATWCGLDEEARESTEVDSLPLEPGRHDVVRLMNLHKAKGLEAPVVFLVDPLGGFDPRVDVRIVREGAEPVGYFQIQEETSGFARRVLAEPAGWAAHKTTEEAYLVAEVSRLMYVAATRAKDTLIVGLWPGRPGNRKPSWTALTQHLAGMPKLVVPAQIGLPLAAAADLSVAAADRAMAATEAAHGQARQASWAATSVTAEIKRIPTYRDDFDKIQARDDWAKIGGTGEGSEGDERGAARDPTRTILPDTASHRADAGQAWGTLVHGLLEHAMRFPSTTPTDLRRLGMWLTVDEPQLREVLDRAVATALAVIASDALAAARNSAECHEEVPFAVQQLRDGLPTVVTGAIDLVHRTDDGWRVVDYKTDADAATVGSNRAYDEQVRAYADAWGRVTTSAVETKVVSARET
jgi:ATP-dependent helicase/nuclease subunit A